MRNYASRHLTSVGLAVLMASTLTGTRIHAEGEPPLSWQSDDYAAIDRAFSVPYPRTTTKGSFLFSIEHRAFEPVNEDPGQNLLGFDSGNLKIGIGLRYGITDEVDVGVRRFNGTVDLFDVYEFDLRMQVQSEASSMLDFSFQTGGTWFDEPEKSDFFGFYGMMTIGKTLADRTYITAGVLHHTESTGPMKTEADETSSSAALFSANFLVRTGLAIVAEFSLPVNGYDSGYGTWAIGPKLQTWGHSFAIVFSNSQFISYDGLSAGSERSNDPVFGFTITREL